MGMRERLTPEEAAERRRASARKSYAKHREKNIARAQAWNAAHPEQYRASLARYAKRHPEVQARSTARWRAKNLEHAKAVDLKRSKAWQKAHPDEYRAYNARYRAAHPTASRDWLARNPGKNAMYQRTYRARKLAVAVAPFTLEDWAALREQYDHRCAYCLRRVKLTQDHIEPLSRGGAHAIDNIVPACHLCNVRKNAQTLLAFLLRGA